MKFKELMTRLNESPYYSIRKLDDEYLTEKLGQFITDGFKLKTVEIKEMNKGEFIYVMVKNKFESIYVWVDEEVKKKQKQYNIIAACNVHKLDVKYKNKELFSPTTSKKYSKKHKNTLKVLYKYIQKLKGGLIICDGMQTEDGKGVWTDWIKNTKVNKIKWWIAYDIRTKEEINITAEKVEDLYSKDNLSYMYKRIIVEFK